jgi:DNA mismatch repair protein MSH5
MTEKERQELEEAEAICRRFLAWDLEADEENVGDGEVQRKLAAVLGIETEVDVEPFRSLTHSL